MIRKVLRYIVTNNSLYLFSAFCMLVSCYLLIGDSPTDRSLLSDLSVLGMMKLYELLVTLIACLVLRRLRVEADGILLAMIAVVLYLDPTLFNTRFHSAGSTAGLVVNGVCLLLALVGLRLLASVGGVPISSSAFRGVGVGAAVIYLSAGLLDPSFTGAQKGASPSQDHLYTVLWFSTLVVALLARRWREEGPRPTESSPQTILVDGQEYDGRAIRVDRYRYLDAVLTYFPFILVLRHLWVLQGVYDVRMFAANLAPVILGVAVLLDRTYTRLRTSAPLLFVGLGWASVLASGHGSPEAVVTLAGVRFTPIHLISILNVAAGIGLHVRTSCRSYLYHAVLVCVPLLCGSTDLLDAATHLRPAFLAPFWIASLLVALRSGKFADALVAGWLTLLVGVRSSGLDAATATGVVTHGALWWLLIAGSLYRVESVRLITPQLAALLLVTTFAGLHGMRHPPSALLPYFSGCTLAFLWLGLVRPDGDTRNVALGFGGTELGVRSLQRLQHIDFAALFRSFGGVGMMALAFAGLFFGLWVSMNKERLLARLGENPGRRS